MEDKKTYRLVMTFNNKIVEYTYHDTESEAFEAAADFQKQRTDLVTLILDSED